MQITPTEIPDVLLIQPKVFQDPRGFFLETYQQARYAAAGIPTAFIQDNHSASRQGVLRGLHYQIQQPQAKLIWAISGEIYDVAVDLRRSSPTFGRWVSTILNAQDRQQIYIPAGFAHGFYVLSPWAEIIYKSSASYAPQWERTLLWNDPDLEIPWPITAGDSPILSPKDQQGTPLQQADLFD